MTIVDIGANIGAHTLLFAKLTGNGGRVIAFEPTDFAFSKLQRNLSLNDAAHVEAVKLALSDADLPPQEVNFRSSWRTDGSRRDGVSAVAFQRLDAWSEQTKLGKIDLVKIDVDGNEFPLIVGGRETIARNRPLILMEAVGPHFDDPNRNPFAVLRELGYRFWDLKNGEEQTVEQMAARLPRNDPGMTKSFNVVAATAPPGT
jgi:FkbM family methyltransferase